VPVLVDSLSLASRVFRKFWTDKNNWNGNFKNLKKIAYFIARKKRELRVIVNFL
jgi:hypothetical protein